MYFVPPSFWASELHVNTLVPKAKRSGIAHPACLPYEPSVLGLVHSRERKILRAGRVNYSQLPAHDLSVPIILSLFIRGGMMSFSNIYSFFLVPKKGARILENASGRGVMSDSVSLRSSE